LRLWSNGSRFRASDGMKLRGKRLRSDGLRFRASDGMKLRGKRFRGDGLKLRGSNLRCDDARLLGVILSLFILVLGFLGAMFTR